MFGSQILEVGIGLILVFLLVSLILTAVREAIESFTRTRARDLELAIAELLGDREGTGLRKRLYEHPLVYSLFPGGITPTKFNHEGKVVSRVSNKLPAYIPREVFAAALQDILKDPDALKASGGDDSHVGTAYQALLDVAGGDADRARKGIERWFDASMDRAAGWFKRRTHRMLFVLGAAIALLLNINAIAIADYLATNETARARLVEVARQAEPAGADKDDEHALARQVDREVRAVGLPIGWDKVQLERTRRAFSDNWLWALVSLIAGYAIVGFAATLGAPFWFDLLGKFMVVRSTVKPTEKSPDEVSKDGGTGGSPKPPKAEEPAEEESDKDD